MKQSQWGRRAAVGLFVVLLLSGVISATVSYAGLLLLEEGWEGILERGRWARSGNDWGDNYQRVQSPIRAGDWSLRFSLDRFKDPVNFRSELRLKQPAEFFIGEEYWFGWSMFLPENWIDDPGNNDIITQWHGRPTTGGGPPLNLKAAGPNWVVQSKWDPTPTNNRKGSPTLDSTAWNLGPIEKGKWTDWVFHVKWSFQADGLLEIWKDGKLVVQRRGPNTFNDPYGPYMKIGIYKFGWKNPDKPSNATERVLYYDEIRIGDVSASYWDVAPKARARLQSPAGLNLTVLGSGETDDLKP